MKKILFCASRASHIINFHLPYIEYFRTNGFRVDTAVQGKIKNNLVNNCFDLKFTKNPLSPDNIKTVFALKKILSEGGYDIICSNTTLAGVATRAALMLMKGKKPYMIHISHGYMFSEKGNVKSKIYLMCEKITKRPVDELVVMNKEDYRLAEKYHLGKNLHYIYGMGIDKNRFPEISENKKADVRKSFDADNEDFVILCVGEFSARKNQTAVIEAFNILSGKYRNLRLVFAGQGKTFDECKNKVSKYELDKKVYFLGQVSDVNQLYRSCDLLVSASFMEGLPFNVMEAMMCGLPVVLSDIKGHNDLIRNGKNGILYENGSILGLTEGIERLISDKSMYQYIKSNTYLPKEYLIENVKPQLLKILDKNYTNKEYYVQGKE